MLTPTSLSVASWYGYAAYILYMCDGVIVLGDSRLKTYIILVVVGLCLWFINVMVIQISIYMQYKEKYEEIQAQSAHI